MSCGAEIGNAAKYNRLLCEEKDFDYMGTAQIVMPENYIALFHTPETEKARQIVLNCLLRTVTNARHTMCTVKRVRRRKDITLKS